MLSDANTSSMVFADEDCCDEKKIVRWCKTSNKIIVRKIEYTNIFLYFLFIGLTLTVVNIFLTKFFLF